MTDTDFEDMAATRSLLPRNEGCFAIVVEGATEAPILWEAEGCSTSYEAARQRLNAMVGPGRHYFRGCIVRLVHYEGNQSVLQQMEAIQK
jgi:hypothetical protein